MTATSFFEFPRPVGALLSRRPAYTGSLLQLNCLNLLLAKQLPGDMRQLLLNKKLCIHLRGTCLIFDFAWTGQRFAARPPVCVKSALARNGIAPNRHRHCQLQQYGTKKRQHEDVDPAQAAAVLQRMTADLCTEAPGASPGVETTHASLPRGVAICAAAPTLR